MDAKSKIIENAEITADELAEIATVFTRELLSSIERPSQRQVQIIHVSGVSVLYIFAARIAQWHDLDAAPSAQSLIRTGASVEWMTDSPFHRWTALSFELARVFAIFV